MHSANGVRHSWKIASSLSRKSSLKRGGLKTEIADQATEIPFAICRVAGDDVQIPEFLLVLADDNYRLSSPFNQKSAYGLSNSAGPSDDQTGFPREFLAHVLPSIQ